MSSFLDKNPVGSAEDFIVLDNETPDFYDRLRSALAGLFVFRNTAASARALTYVSGSCFLGPYSTLDAPALIAIDGDLLFGPGATLRAPALLRVRGKINLEHDATLHAPLLPESTARKIQHCGRYTK